MQADGPLVRAARCRMGEEKASAAMAGSGGGYGHRAVHPRDLSPARILTSGVRCAGIFFYGVFTGHTGRDTG